MPMPMRVRRRKGEQSKGEPQWWDQQQGSWSAWAWTQERASVTLALPFRFVCCRCCRCWDLLFFGWLVVRRSSGDKLTRRSVMRQKQLPVLTWP